MPIEFLAPSVLPSLPPTELPVDTFFAAYRRVVGDRLGMHGLTLGPTPPIVTKDAEFPLMMTVMVLSDIQGTVMLSYGDWAVSAAEADRLAETYIQFLDAATAAPDCALDAVFTQVKQA